MRRMLDLGLSDREKFFIAEIISQWGAIEHEVFVQTLSSYDKGDALPKEMNNLQFSGVLKLWKQRVVDASQDERLRVLQDVHSSIVSHQDARNALVHGMWSWEPGSPGQIFVTRVKKDEIIRTTFTGDSLESLALDVSELNFNLRYPEGLADLAAERAQQGYSMSRRWAAMMSGHPVADELAGPQPR